jgi:hypothetical protein
MCTGDDMAFPDIVYKKGGPHRGPKGSTYKYKGVSCEAEMQSALSAGYFKCLHEAIAPAPAPAPVDDGEDFKRYEELTDDEKLEIIELVESGKDKKEVREKFNIHHLTLKKLMS